MGPRGPVNRGPIRPYTPVKTSARYLVLQQMKLTRRRRFDRIETESALFVWNISHGKGCKTRARAIQSPKVASERGSAMYHSTKRSKSLKTPRTEVM